MLHALSLRSEALLMSEASQLSQTAAAAVSNYAQVAQQALNSELLCVVIRTVSYFGKVHPQSASSLHANLEHSSLLCRPAKQMLVGTSAPANTLALEFNTYVTEGYVGCNIGHATPWSNPFCLAGYRCIARRAGFGAVELGAREIDASRTAQRAQLQERPAREPQE